jgi:hypothetical protein
LVSREFKLLLFTDKTGRPLATSFNDSLGVCLSKQDLVNANGFIILSYLYNWTGEKIACTVIAFFTDKNYTRPDFSETKTSSNLIQMRVYSGRNK